MIKNYTIKEWSILWFLYNSSNKYRSTPHSFSEFESDMGYKKIQSGGIRKFFSYLVKEGVLIKKQIIRFNNISLYIINKKRIDEIIINQPLYHIISNLYYGEAISNSYKIPLPSEM